MTTTRGSATGTMVRVKLRASSREAPWFAGYRLEELVNESQAGVVYKALDVRLQRTVALRIVAAELTNDPVARARLNREATAIARVDHPNVLPIYDVGEHDGRMFIASGWVDARRLDTLMRDEGPLEPRRAVALINQVARALQTTHDHGIIHRNVRPSSILVTPSDHVYLTDFEYARPLTDATLVVLRDHLLDEVDYIAPEHIAGQATDARADIYGLGAVLYEMLTGAVPFPAGAVAAKVYAHRFTAPPSARARRPNVPEGLDAVIARAMAKDPAERQQSAGQFAIEAAGAVDTTAPLWATRRRTIDAPEHRPAPPTAHVSAASVPAEPAVYMSRGRRLRHWALGAVLLLLFVAAPIVLLLTVG